MNEKSIFAAALEIESPAQRQAFLEHACAENDMLRSQVEELLQASIQAGSFLDVPLAGFEVATEAFTDSNCGTAVDTDIRPFLSPCDKPDRIGKLDQYEIIEVVGHGGMGTVLRAFDTKLSRVVALKVMAPELAANPTAVRRFLREATTAAAVVHDHVVTIYAVDDAHRPPFLVMEFVEGQTLHQKIQREGALELRTILRIGSQSAAGLAAAHKTGLIHRDVKPANILLENGIERVKITDFGLARAADDLEMTKAGMIAGTPQYMSPEQAKGESIDTRSDLFSLGSVLYTMCTGRPAFRAETTMGVLKRVCEDEPRAVHEVNPEIPDWLEAIVDKLLSKSPDERFQSAAEVADLLSQHLAHLQQPTSIPQPPLVSTSRPKKGEEQVTARANLPRLFHAPHWQLGAAAAVLLCVGLALAESTGMTKLAASVVRIVRGDGTLIVEVDDPNIQVLLDGDEIAITGAGPKEFRLRPGEHQVQSVKDGKPVVTKLITITRDGREIVKVAREAPPAIVQAAPTTRLVWDKAEDVYGLSSDGHYLSFVDWETGDVAVRDLTTGKNRRVTNKGTWLQSTEFALWPRISPDCKQLGYTWYDKQGKPDLRLIGLDGGDPRVAYSSKDDGITPEVCGWTPDGNQILAKLYLKPKGSEQPRAQLVLITTADGSVRVIKEYSGESGENGGVALAPDGQTIAYNRITEPGIGQQDIFLLDVETGQETPVETHVADKRILAWTPDGQRLLFDMERQEARDAWMIRIAAGKPLGEAELVKKDLGGIGPLGFTRDGTFYYVLRSKGTSLFTATLDVEKGTAAATPLAAEKYNLTDHLALGDWSPDGDQLVYWARGSWRPQSAHELRIVSLKTGQMRVLKQDLTFIQPRMRWSPDGRSILAAGARNVAAGTGPQPGIFQIDAVNGQATVVVNGPGALQPVWSRDGQGIFFSRMPYLFGQLVPNFLARNRPIVFRDLQTKAEKEVLTPGDPDFDGKLGFWFEPSPDGRQLALLGKPSDESMVLWLIPVDGGASRELFKVNAPGTSPGGLVWSPDGHFLLFTQLAGDEAQRGLWLVSANGGAPQKIALTGMDPKAVTRLAIHPDGKQLALTAQGTGKSEIWALENFLPPLKNTQRSSALSTAR